MLASLLTALKTEEVVLVELVEPTSCAMSLFAISFSSCVSVVGVDLTLPFDVPVAGIWPSPSRSERAGIAENAPEEQDWSADGD